MTDYRALAAAYARKHRIPEQVFLRQIKMESGFNPNARSPAGAEGIAQFMPATARSHGLRNPYDPNAALDAAARFDQQLFRKYGLAGGLSVYNSGRPNTYRDPGFAGGQTYRYVKSILGGANVTAPPNSPMPMRAPTPTLGQPTMQPQGLDRAGLATALIQSIGERMHHGHSDMGALSSNLAMLQQESRQLVPSETHGETYHSPADHKGVQKVGSMVFPVAGPHQFTDTWGASRPDIPGGHHQGTDIFAPKGTPVVAVENGTVSKMGPSQIGGNRIWINGTWYYAHLSRFASGIKPGVKVRQGQVIGYVGNTGDARGTPPHLHFGWSPNGSQGASWANPFPVLRGRASP